MTASDAPIPERSREKGNRGQDSDEASPVVDLHVVLIGDRLQEDPGNLASNLLNVNTAESRAVPVFGHAANANPNVALFHLPDVPEVTP